jgi:hypothetical protein
MNIKQKIILFIIIILINCRVFCEVNIIDKVEFKEAESVINETDGRIYNVFKIEILEFENVYFLKSYYRENNEIKYKIKRLGGI